MKVKTGLVRSGASRIVMPFDFSRYCAMPRNVSTCSTLAGGAADAALQEDAAIAAGTRNATRKRRMLLRASERSSVVRNAVRPVGQAVVAAVAAPVVHLHRHDALRVGAAAMMPDRAVCRSDE